MYGMRRPMPRREFLRSAGIAGLGAAAAPLLAACSREAKRLAFLNWTNYIDPNTISRFENENGIDVTYQTYVSNDELERILIQATRPRRGGRTGASFDLMVPSDDFVRLFKDLSLLEEIDTAKLQNIGNLSPAFRNEGFDPGNRHTIPWATGTTGIGYDATILTEPPDWNVFLETRFAGKMTILAEMRDAFAAGLFSLGLDPNTTSQADIDAARDRLIEMKAVIRGFDSTSYLDDLANGSLVAAQAYSGDLLQAKARNPKLGFVIPSAGGGRWVDSLAVPVDAPQPDHALTFMDFYLRPEISAEVGNFIQYDTGNAAAFDLLDATIQANPVIFPPPDVLDRVVFTADLGSEVEARYAADWKQVQAA
jgi:putrescine transport system substrate-binding protein